jgi:aspartate/methionine/tyrosine aminotransferase
VPKHPELSAESQLRESVFAKLALRFSQHSGKLYPLHIGDTCFSPSVSDIEIADSADVSRYGHPCGLDELITELIARLRRRFDVGIESQQVQITSGATHALVCATRTVLGPGDECLLLAPYWPLIRGIVTMTGAKAVEVPFYQELYARPDANDANEADVAALLAPFLTERTTAIYVTSPNNPDGKILERRQLQALDELARQHNLWIFSDECYESYAYERPFVSMLQQGDASRTFVVFSFSKSHALAGLRLGALVGPAGVMAVARRIANHTTYNPPVVLQRATARALREGDSHVETMRQEARAARDLAVAALRESPARFYVPDGGAYVFIDARPVLGGKPIDGLLEELLRVGVALAPGVAFGAYEPFARLCFTACPAPDLQEALRRLCGVLNQHRNVA